MVCVYMCIYVNACSYNYILSIFYFSTFIIFLFNVWVFLTFVKCAVVVNFVVYYLLIFWLLFLDCVWDSYRINAGFVPLRALHFCCISFFLLVSLCGNMFRCVSVCVHACMYTFMQTGTHSLVYICVFVCARLYVFMYICGCKCAPPNAFSCFICFSTFAF